MTCPVAATMLECGAPRDQCIHLMGEDGDLVGALISLERFPFNNPAWPRLDLDEAASLLREGPPGMEMVVEAWPAAGRDCLLLSMDALNGWLSMASFLTECAP